MAAYYNEIDKKAAAWLRELIKENHIAPGEVDERSIEDVTPNDLRDFTQCHFFAGVGVWSYALRKAGWPDDRRVWTGSCPCQPFSSAGKRAGIADERHLWPSWYWLISECQKAWGEPVTIFGEQVASGDGLAWLDIVQADLEAAGYAVGAKDLCSAGVGSPNIRQRLYWVADACSSPCKRDAGEFSATETRVGGEGQQNGNFSNGSRDGCSISRLDNSKHGRPTDKEQESEFGLSNVACGLGNTQYDGSFRKPQFTEPESEGRLFESQGSGDIGGRTSGPVNGFWRDASWVYCRDERWRPFEPTAFPLANGSPGRVGLLRGTGNAINAELATTFIKSYLEIGAM